VRAREDLLHKARICVASRATGLIFGRNMWQRPFEEAGLFYVYVGNVPGEANTTCHACGHLLIRRLGYQIMANDVAPGGHCPKCGMPVAGRGMAETAAS
jgi:hypothetical protein